MGEMADWQLEREEDGPLIRALVFGPWRTTIDCPPSQDTENFWHSVECKKRRKNVDPAYVGKWMIFVPLYSLDKTWDRVKSEVIAGHLGMSAKVSTARPNSLANDPNTKVIIVYTKDYRDIDDVMRVREHLRQMGFVTTLGYKTDAATNAGKHGESSWMLRS